MIIKNLNNADVIMAKVEGICKFLIDKEGHRIIQTQHMTKEMEQDITTECINLGCKYLIDSQGNICVDYKVGNILVKILYNAVDMDCIQFFADHNFEVSYA